MDDIIQSSRTGDNSRAWSAIKPDLVIVDVYDSGDVVLLVEKDGKRAVAEIVECRRPVSRLLTQWAMDALGVRRSFATALSYLGQHGSARPIPDGYRKKHDGVFGLSGVGLHRSFRHNSPIPSREHQRAEAGK